MNQSRSEILDALGKAQAEYEAAAAKAEAGDSQALSEMADLRESVARWEGVLRDFDAIQAARAARLRREDSEREMAAQVSRIQAAIEASRQLGEVGEELSEQVGAIPATLAKVERLHNIVTDAIRDLPEPDRSHVERLAAPWIEPLAALVAQAAPELDQVALKFHADEYRRAGIPVAVQITERYRRLNDVLERGLARLPGSP